jgi:hypothetical protein
VTFHEVIQRSVLAGSQSLHVGPVQRVGLPFRIRYLFCVVGFVTHGVAECESGARLRFANA